MWPIKNFEKYFMAHQYTPKIFHHSHKNPLLLPSPTYLMLGPLFGDGLILLVLPIRCSTSLYLLRDPPCPD